MKELISKQELNNIVNRLAGEIVKDISRDEVPVLVCVLKGGYMFMSDLCRAMGIELETDFIRARSYGDATKSPGSVEITRDVETDLSGRSVIIVEDIVDTGITLDAILTHISAMNPAHLKVCSLLDKPSRRVRACRIDYLGREIGDRFVVGYGMDHAEKYRGLPAVFVLD